MKPPLSLSSSVFLLLLFTLSLLIPHSLSFQSDELLLDDDEFGLEGAPARPSPDTEYAPRSPSPATTATTTTTSRRRSSESESDSNSKVQFALEHAFGDSEFSRAGTFSARLKSWANGDQTLTKLRFTRNTLTDAEKEKFKVLLQEDDFYKIRLPSNVLNPPGRNYTVSAVKARCLVREALDEHLIIHMEGVNALGVNYGSPGACPYPRQLKVPSKWAFISHAVLKYSEQGPRTPVFVEETPGVTAEGEGMPLPEKSFWAKYWMYLIPLGLIVMNAVTQAMNMPEEQAAGEAGAVQQPGRAAPAPARRR